MLKNTAVVLLSCLLLAGCGPDQIIADMPSPDGQHHVEVRKCPQRGSMTWSQMTQVSILKAGESEQCHSSMTALAQFRSHTPDDQLQLEWLSNTELRAWHPGFEQSAAPISASYKQGTPIELTYSPAR